MKKHLSLRWKLTLMTAFMVITACLAISLFISRSAILYMDEIGNSAIAILPNTDIPTTTTDEIQVVLNPKSVVADTVKNTQIEFWIKSLAITLIITLTVSFLMYLIVGYALYPLRELTLQIEDIQAKNLKEPILSKSNSTEIENIKKAHVKDGVAMVKFIYWVKKNVGKMKITEISASDYLEDRRREQEGFIELSFDTIAAYNANAAMMHYSATPEHDTELKPEGFFLVDSGGQYYEGTTDITRTIVLGPLKDEWKRDYTLTLKGHMNLLNAKFLYGCTGINLDILCRAPLWNIGIDYRCGTGHGVGYLLNVHEAPNGFRWKMVPERNDSAVLEEGMITTDEPGVYTENSHGIRIENELLCKKDIKNEYGQFMCFESVTYCPIDKEAIDVKYLEKRDIEQIDDYHKLVYKELSPYFEGEELAWLKEACEPIKGE